jgi:hypothetical protein
LGLVKRERKIEQVVIQMGDLESRSGLCGLLCEVVITEGRSESTRHIIICKTELVNFYRRPCPNELVTKLAMITALSQGGHSKGKIAETSNV